MLYTWNYYNISCQLYFNKNKFKCTNPHKRHFLMINLLTCNTKRIHILLLLKGSIEKY